MTLVPQASASCSAGVPMPLAPPWIAGVVNLRGQIIPLIYLSRRLGLEQTSYQRNTRFVIVRSREQSVGFVVDEVLEVLQLNADKTEPPPGHLDYREYIHAVSKQERGMVMVLDLNKILYHHPQARIDVLEEAL